MISMIIHTYSFLLGTYIDYPFDDSIPAGHCLMACWDRGTSCCTPQDGGLHIPVSSWSIIPYSLSIQWLGGSLLELWVFIFPIK